MALGLAGEGRAEWLRLLTLSLQRSGRGAEWQARPQVPEKPDRRWQRSCPLRGGFRPMLLQAHCRAPAAGLLILWACCDCDSPLRGLPSSLGKEVPQGPPCPPPWVGPWPCLLWSPHLLPPTVPEGSCVTQGLPPPHPLVLLLCSISGEQGLCTAVPCLKRPSPDGGSLASLALPQPQIPPSPSLPPVPSPPPGPQLPLPQQLRAHGGLTTEGGCRAGVLPCLWPRCQCLGTG